MKKTAAPTTSSGSNPEQDEILKKIGARVRILRKAQNPNYIEWAKQHPTVNRGQLLRLEQGGNCTFKTLLTILDELEIGVQLFFSTLDETK
jgi:hypothetical protein